MPAGQRVAIVGAGIGGLALAGALSARGMAVRVYEQANRFARVGAGITLSANAVRVLRELGLEPALRARGFIPTDFVHRAAATGETTNKVPLGAGPSRSTLRAIRPPRPRPRT